MTSAVLKKAGLASVALVLGACSCYKSPDLDVAPMPVKSSYEEPSKMMGDDVKSYDHRGDVSATNTMDVKEKFMAMVGSNKVYYDYDSSRLDPKDRASLDQIAKFVRQNDVESLTVEGHCDERGTREYNLALGERRAVAAKRYLVSKGVEADKITTISYGKERPAVPGHNKAAWAKNRRAVVVLD